MKGLKDCFIYYTPIYLLFLVLVFFHDFSDHLIRSSLLSANEASHDGPSQGRWSEMYMQRMQYLKNVQNVIEMP